MDAVSFKSLLSTAIKVEKTQWCDGSFGEPIGEINSLIQSHNVKAVKSMFENSGWTVKQFEDALIAKTCEKWVHNHFGYFFSVACELPDSLTGE